MSDIVIGPDSDGEMWRFIDGWWQWNRGDRWRNAESYEVDSLLPLVGAELERLRAALENVGHGLADECLDDLADPGAMGHLAGLRYRALAASTGEED